ncbi:uncharacterized protein LOC111640710 [Centruroides sculpturatus]|uniref:uncharacterized protein LOC111640710 n=1 Tax=Centruroides sculpturatus TaxID=218467 RepID=UPI000C6E364A|nr:uncharacterized protein LOC111640710 [Centruroides sculpturatus]
MITIREIFLHFVTDVVEVGLLTNEGILQEDRDLEKDTSVRVVPEKGTERGEMIVRKLVIKTEDIDQDHQDIRKNQVNTVEGKKKTIQVIEKEEISEGRNEKIVKGESRDKIAEANALRAILGLPPLRP